MIVIIMRMGGSNSVRPHWGWGAREKNCLCNKAQGRGLCILSKFFWHGTNSFSSVNPRLTIPIDIDPDS